MVDAPERPLSEDASHILTIPNVDSKNQKRERLQIVLRGITKQFNELGTKFAMQSNTWSCLSKLVNTFNLTAKNVFVDPRMNEMLLVILLRLVSEFETVVDKSDEKSYEVFVISVFEHFGYHSLEELENFVNCFWKI